MTKVIISVTTLQPNDTDFLSAFKSPGFGHVFVLHLDKAIFLSSAKFYLKTFAIWSFLPQLRVATSQLCQLWRFEIGAKMEEKVTILQSLCTI